MYGGGGGGGGGAYFRAGGMGTAWPLVPVSCKHVPTSSAVKLGSGYRSGGCAGVGAGTCSATFAGSPRCSECICSCIRVVEPDGAYPRRKPLLPIRGGGCSCGGAAVARISPPSQPVGPLGEGVERESIELPVVDEAGEVCKSKR